MKKALPVGIEFYKQLIEKPYYYVDKTLIIKELLDGGGAVSLIIPGLFEPPVRTLRATIPENESHIFR